MTYQGLVMFDVDGTLIREKTVCELIAEKIDKTERMAWLERHSASPAEFVIAAREEMADWYTDAGQKAVEGFFDSVVWAEAAHTGVSALVESGWLVAIASMTWKFGVERIASDLGISELIATDFDWESKRIDHVFPGDKANYLKRLAYQHRIPDDRVFAVGDSSGDVPMLTTAQRGYFVGENDPHIQGVLHFPDAGIDEIARHMLNTKF